MLRFITTRKLTNVPQLGLFKLPEIKNEPMEEYRVGSKERHKLQDELDRLYSVIENAPIRINTNNQKLNTQKLPFKHQTALCTWTETSSEEVEIAIERALLAKPAWETMPFNDRCSIFLRAADLLTGKYKAQIIASTMLGQGKNVWQAEIDASAELADFWRFNCLFAQQLYNDQPSQNAKSTWNRMEYRPLEGFVVAFSPFNFTAIGGNLACAPALMGNVVLWKPSPMSMHSNSLIMKILLEAGLPENVIQFIPGDAQTVSDVVFDHKEFAGLHFTGSTSVFKHLYKRIVNNLDNYQSYPRIVGETGANVRQAVLQTIRSSFEYNGQKCSACSRVYVPDNLWPEYKSMLLQEMAKIRQGDVSAVINEQSFDKIKSIIDSVKKDTTCEIIAGGMCDKSVGYFIQPTAIVTRDPKSITMTTELFGPVVTLFVYQADKYEETMQLANETTHYSLTCALFATERQAIILGSNTLRNAAGNFYLNDKCTGAVVGQQAFGGGRMSGTNDKAGSILNLIRWVSPRTIKENFTEIQAFDYPSNKK